jgi:hypothetical protein
LSSTIVATFGENGGCTIDGGVHIGGPKLPPVAGQELDHGQVGGAQGVDPGLDGLADLFGHGHPVHLGDRLKSAGLVWGKAC